MLYLIQSNIDFPKYINSTDRIILMQDGVYLALQMGREHPSCNVYALLDDIKARGLQTHVPKEIILITYDDFVKLSEQHEKIVSWY